MLSLAENKRPSLSRSRSRSPKRVPSRSRSRSQSRSHSLSRAATPIIEFASEPDFEQFEFGVASGSGGGGGGGIASAHSDTKYAIDIEVRVMYRYVTGDMKMCGSWKFAEPKQPNTFVFPYRAEREIQYFVSVTDRTPAGVYSNGQCVTFTVSLGCWDAASETMKFTEVTKTCAGTSPLTEPMRWPHAGGRTLRSMGVVASEDGKIACVQSEAIRVDVAVECETTRKAVRARRPLPHNPITAPGLGETASASAAGSGGEAAACLTAAASFDSAAANELKQLSTAVVPVPKLVRSESVVVSGESCSSDSLRVCNCGCDFDPFVYSKSVQIHVL